MSFLHTRGLEILLNTQRRAGVLVAVLVSLWGAAPALARVDVCYYGGPNLPNFRLNGDAQLDGTSLVVTESIPNQRSSTTYQTPLSTSGDIKIQMKLKISDHNSGGADGMAFVMHNDPLGIAALGLAGSGIGYEGITNSVIVEFDTYNNGAPDYNNANHVAIHKNGSAYSNGADGLAYMSAPFSLKTVGEFWVWVDYTAAGTSLEVYLSQTSTKPLAANLSATVDLTTVVGAQMYLAFTGSTGGAQSKHEVLELLASDTGEPGEACCTTAADCAASPLGTACDPVKRSCGPCALAQTNGCTSPQEACAVHQSNACTSYCDGDYGSGGANACASEAFAVCQTTGPATGSCVVCDADYQQAGDAPCPSGAPTCLPNGYCGRCTSNEDCSGAGRAGNRCDTSTGRCTTCTSSAECSGSATCSGGWCVCTQDSDCGSSAFCSAGTCYPKLFAGETYPSSRACPGNASDACLSGVCNTGGTCGAPGGSACTRLSDCASRTCVSSVCGCELDVHCSAGEHCAYATHTCVADLSPGTGIPNDGLHNGTCSPATAAAVCASGLCNSVAHTCAEGLGTACTQSNQCQSNACTSGHCVAASNGCYLDGDCAANQYCDRATFSCAADLASGSAIPNDGLHGGTCTDAAAVCASGLCNSTTTTCASSNGAACTQGDQCVTDTCTSGHCVPASNGCYLDGDCAANQYCDRATFSCAADLTSGSAIPNDGLHGGTCSDAAAVCSTGSCNSTTNTCASADATACTHANQCISNTCTSGHCVPSSNGCYLDGDCATNQHCDRANLTCAADLSAGSAIPNDGLHGGTCTDAAAVCASGLCNTATSTCGATHGTVCTHANQCQSNTCTSGACVPAVNGCFVDADCAGNQHCDRATFTCAADLAAGTAIPNDGLHGGTCADASEVCASGLCNTATSTCAASNGNACTHANQCQHNTCTSGYCVPSSGGCYLDGDCAAGQYCNRATLLCVAQLSAGAAIPNDGLHDGSCSLSNAQAVCASGLCNTATDTCAASNGTSCTQADQCQTNTCTSGACVPSSNGCYQDADCGVNDYCDRANLLCAPKLAAGSPVPNDGLHDGTCATATPVCDTGLCNTTTNTCGSADGASCTLANQCQTNTCTSQRCVPAVGGCYLDGDCANHQYCDRTNLLCVSKLLAGAPVPSDGLHGGTCADAAEVCASGLCNAATDTCAASNGTACTNANQCQNNTCTSGHCVPPTGGCYLDADCSAGSYCDRSTLSCAATLGAGVAIPNDGLHGGTCADASLVCASGMCNATTNTCADTDGQVCLVAAQCQSNTCTSGHCVPATLGCYLDGDCAAGTYCDRSSLSCAAKLAPGAPVPNDGLHDGTCATAGALCQSGQCNPATHTCGATEGTGCTQNSQCASNACTSLTCVPNTGGCFVDSDCGANAWCDRSQLLCQPKRGAGQPLPSDGLHGGACTPDLAAAVCSSGRCNPVTNTCAEEVSQGCTSNQQCTTNTCTSSTCVPASNGCGQNADCPSGSYCDGQSFTCQPKLAPGSAIPADGIQQGCSEASAADVCETGVCNASNGTCALPEREACTTDGQCGSNRCVAGQCGGTVRFTGGATGLGCAHLPADAGGLGGLALMALMLLARARRRER